MAEQLDLEERPSSRLRGEVWWGVAALVLLLVVAALTGGAVLLLAGCVIAGTGLTYLSGLSLSLEERLAYGTVVGALITAGIGLLMALAFGLTLPTVLAALVVSAGVSGPGWLRAARGPLRADLAAAALRWRRWEDWPLWLLLSVAWPFTLILLGRAYQYTPAGLVAGNPGAYADWAAHLTYAGSFAYGSNFPPQFPIDPGHPLTYPFLVDFLGAMMVPLGSSLTSALVLSSGLLALAFPVVMYVAALRLAGSRGGAALAVLVFTLSGGLGFVYFFLDLARQGAAALQHLPRLYTQMPDVNIQWLNPVLAWMLPQRSVLFGYSLALLALAVLWQAVRTGEGGWRPYAFAGVVAGLTPLAHLHAYGTVVALAGFWLLFGPRREWAAFFVPALVLGLPVTFWMLGGGAAQVHVQLWWLADTQNHADGPLWFWLKNTGIFIPLLAVAFFWRGLLPRPLALYLAPIWLWFLVPNVYVLQPWDWDNTKFFAYWALLGAIPVGALLARLFSESWAPRTLAAGLAVVLMLAGALDLWRTMDARVSSALFTDSAGVQAAQWVRDNTPARSVFLVAPDHNQPIPTLGGRSVVAGYPGWLWTYALSDWGQRTDDVKKMLAGSPGTPEMLRRYGVDYVVLGPAEEASYGARPEYWDAHGRRVYSNGTYTVYRVG